MGPKDLGISPCLQYRAIQHLLRIHLNLPVIDLSNNSMLRPNGHTTIRDTNQHKPHSLDMDMSVSFSLV